MPNATPAASYEEEHHLMMTIAKQLSKLALVSLFISGCSQTYDVHSNVAPDNFEEYFKPSQVRVYTAETIPEGSRTLAAVTGSSCQQTPADRPANMAEARTQAKRAVAELEASALVIDVCETQQKTEIPQCHQLLTCYGRALLLPEAAQR